MIVMCAAGADNMKLMALSMPIAVQVMSPTLTKYAFPPNQMGIMQMLMACAPHQVCTIEVLVAFSYVHLIIPSRTHASYCSCTRSLTPSSRRSWTT